MKSVDQQLSWKQTTAGPRDQLHYFCSGGLALYMGLDSSLAVHLMLDLPLPSMPHREPNTL